MISTEKTERKQNLK